MSLVRTSPHTPLALKSTLLLLVAVMATGCADEGVSDGDSLPPLVTAQVDLRIGSLDDPDELLTVVGGILPGPDGRFWVSQPQDRQIRIHGADGGLLHRFGSSGEGPGEFQGLSAMGWWGESADTLWVGDFQLVRLSLFDSAGSFLRSIPLRVEPYREVMAVRSVSAMTPEGVALTTPSFPSHLLAQGEIEAIPLLRFDPRSDGPPQVVLETVPGNTQLAINMGTWMGFTGQPFSDRPMVWVSGAARKVVVAERDPATSSTQAFTRVTAFDLDGDAIWTRQLGYEPLPIPRSEVDSIVDAQVENWLSFAEQAGVGQGALRGQIRENLFAPEYRPPIAGGFVADDGSTWVRWTSAPGADVHRWLRLDADGVPVARIEVPRNLGLRTYDGEHLWGVETDEYDVPYVVRLRIPESRPPDGATTG